MDILLIDNNDSFTFNLYHLIRDVSGKNDKVSVVGGDSWDPEGAADADHIVFSPGPGLPEEFPLMRAVLSLHGNRTPILGVCLGHQSIGEYFGGSLTPLSLPFHGVKSTIRRVGESRLLAGLPAYIDVARYHSWVLDRQSLPQCLVVTAEDHDGDVMAMEHRESNIFGVQFHPESFLTEVGGQIMKNFLNIVP